MAIAWFKCICPRKSHIWWQDSPNFQNFEKILKILNKESKVSANPLGLSTCRKSVVKKPELNSLFLISGLKIGSGNSQLNDIHSAVIDCFHNCPRECLQTCFNSMDVKECCFWMQKYVRRNLNGSSNRTYNSLTCMFYFSVTILMKPRSKILSSSYRMNQFTGNYAADY